MPRLESLRYSLADARRILRDRMRRFLPVASTKVRHQRPTSRASDDSVVKLLSGITIQFGNDVDAFRQRYDAARASFPSAPAFDDLVREAWIRPVWGRVSAPLDTARLVARQSDDMRQALVAALGARHSQYVEVGEEAEADPTVRALAQPLESDPPNWAGMQSLSPAWVAARLWEKTPSTLSNGLERLRWWLDRWDILHAPAVTLGTAWESASAKTFAEAGLSALSLEPGFLNWTDLRSHLIARMALASDREVPELEPAIAPVPSTMLERVRWLDDRGFEHVRDDHDSCGDLWGVARLLLDEVADVDMSPTPHPLAQSVLDLAVERPELLDIVMMAVHQQPVLLADVLLDRRLAAVACVAVAEWPSVGGAWDRDVISNDFEAARLSAFADAVGVLGHLLEARATAPGECAALLTWMHGAATSWRGSYQQRPTVNDRMFAALRSELLRLPADVLLGIFNGLATMPNGLGSPAFAATVDVLVLAALATVVEPSPVVDTYVRSVQSRDHSVSASRIDPAGAQALAQLAARSDEKRARDFLSPLDVKGTLERTNSIDAFAVTDGLVRALRAHIRVLARAVSAWPDTPPADLVSALAANVRAGALSHAERGRVPALGARYEAGVSYGPDERPIAFDLGDAIAALPEDAREPVLAAVLECDEPLTLAQLLTVAPAATRERIRRRIVQLTPQEAGRVMSLTEAQARVEALLSAGLADAAASFIEAERDLSTLGAVPGRSLARLRAQLRLHLLRKDFAAIESAALPADLALSDQAEGANVLEFYRAVAQLSTPAGEAEKARQAFERLHKRRPDVAGYVVNMLAAEASSLLAGNLFGKLQGANIAQARRALADADAALARCRAIGEEDRAIHECNRALLLLATGQPDRAYQGLLGITSSELGERVAGYSAVALSRMGRPDEALSALDRATRAFGSTELLEAARSQIRGGTPYEARPTAATSADPLPGLQAALTNILGLDPFRQAEVYQPPPDPFDSLLIHHVRSAAASVVALVPVMKDVRLDSCEDDLSLLVQALLRSRLEFLHWSVSDQSTGGFTAAGNAGARDLVIMKDSVVLAVLEAVVCKRPASHAHTQGELTSHLQKLLGYATCRLFFHVTYSYVDDPGAVLAELKREAQTQAPSGFEYLGLLDIPLTDTRPTGFVASYRSSLGESKVVFLLLDMQQQAQRAAAITADASNPRKKKTDAKTTPSKQK